MPEDYMKDVRTACGYKEVDTRQLVSMFAGDTLWDVAQTIKNVSNTVSLLGKLSDLMKWMARANLRGICHFDLKAQNIMYDGTQLRVIDWGLADDIRSLFTTEAPALYFPPDFHVARHVARCVFTPEETQAETERLLRQLCNHLSIIGIERFPIFISRLMAQDVALATTQTIAAFESFAGLPLREAYQAFKDVQRVDTYMFGFALVEFACLTASTPSINEVLGEVLVEVVLPMMRLNYTERTSLQAASRSLDLYIAHLEEM
jgi:serine/threonine protein kinase